MKKKIREHLKIERTKPILNPCEATNLEKEVIFIAIPKTGSSGVRRATSGRKHYLITQEHLYVEECRFALNAFLVYRRLGRNWQFPCSESPSTRKIFEEAQNIWDRSVKFTMVRNPWARVVSLYFRNEGIKVRKKMTFNEFVEQLRFASDTCVNPSRHSNQIEWLVDTAGNWQIDFLIKLEEFEKRIAEVNQRLLNRVSLNGEKRNVNPISKSFDYREMYNEETKRVVHRLFERDIYVFEYIF